MVVNDQQGLVGGIENSALTTNSIQVPSLRGEVWYKKFRIARLSYVIALSLFLANLFPVSDMIFAMSTRKIELKFLALNYFLPIFFSYYLVVAFFFWIVYIWGRGILVDALPNFSVSLDSFELYRKKMIKNITLYSVSAIGFFFLGISTLVSAISFYNSYQHLASMGPIILFNVSLFVLLGTMSLISLIQFIGLFNPEKASGEMINFMVFLYPFWKKLYKKGIIRAET